MTLLSIKNVTVRFGGLAALSEVNMEIKNGEIHSVIGPNGSGKTTLVNTISGFYPHEGGEIYFDGDMLNPLSPWERARLGINRSFQRQQLISSMTVLENVMGGFHRNMKASIFQAAIRTRKWKAEEQECVENAYELLELVGIENLHSKGVKELSVGQQRLVEIARTIAAGPKLLMLDEPAAGLSPVAVQMLDELLIRLREKANVTILMVEHVLSLVFSISDRISVLSQGRKIVEGSPFEIKESTIVRNAYLGR
jgi:branched-chain amino acid transport system ATP-binding protein